MINTNEIKIGVDIYEVVKDAEMGGTHLGSINQSHGLIKMREIGFDNRPIPKRMYMKVLMHEIVHGIDFNTFFVCEDKENDLDASEDAIDLVTVFILRNLDAIMQEREVVYQDFVEYMEATECNVKRLPLLFYGILDVIDDNPELIQEFLEVYK